jgi:hypothetical protein
MRRSIQLATAGFLVALASTACSSSGSGAPPATAPKGISTPASTPTAPASSPAAASGDGCQYATVAEVSAAVGATVTAQPVPAGPPYNVPSCLYASSTVPVRQITVAVYTKDDLSAVGGQTAETFLAVVKGGLTNVQPISGLGDEAFSAGSAGTSVYVRTGTTIVHVTAGVGGTSATAVAATRAVAAAVVGNL